MSDKRELIIYGTHKIRCTYTNWRGETAVRRIGPAHIFFGTTEWHTEPQWFMSGVDLEEMKFRDFAMRDMKDVVYE